MPSGQRRSARGRGRYNLLSRAIKNKPFQWSDGLDSQQRRRTAARVEQRDLFFILYIICSLFCILLFVLYIIGSCHKQDKKRYSCPVPRVPMATIRPRSNAKIEQLLWHVHFCCYFPRFTKWKQGPGHWHSIDFKRIWKRAFFECTVGRTHPNYHATWNQNLNLGLSCKLNSSCKIV